MTLTPGRALVAMLGAVVALSLFHSIRRSPSTTGSHPVEGGTKINNLDD
jgi:hypothetical protein